MAHHHTEMNVFPIFRNSSPPGDRSALQTNLKKTPLQATLLYPPKILPQTSTSGAFNCGRITVPLLDPKRSLASARQNTSACKVAPRLRDKDKDGERRQRPGTTSLSIFPALLVGAGEGSVLRFKWQRREETRPRMERRRGGGVGAEPGSANKTSGSQGRT